MSGYAEGENSNWRRYTKGREAKEDLAQGGTARRLQSVDRKHLDGIYRSIRSAE